MFSRKWAAPLAAAFLMVVAGTQAIAGKTIQTTIVPITLPSITPGGEIDVDAEGTEAVALAEYSYSRGEIVLEVESQGEVANLSNKKFKTSDYSDFEFFFGPDITITKFSYSVSKSGKAVLKMTAVGSIPAPPGP